METFKTHTTAGSGITRAWKRDSDYLRFRPYHAFTVQQPQSNHRAVLRRIALIVGFLALLIFSGKLLIYVIT